MGGLEKFATIISRNAGRVANFSPLEDPEVSHRKPRELTAWWQIIAGNKTGVRGASSARENS